MRFFLIILARSYLSGSIPFGYIFVRVFQGQDVRESGSGNIGATNVARSSPLLGLFTLLLDAGKGLLAVAFAKLLCGYCSPSLPERATSAAVCAALATLAALVAICAHMFPIWLKFKGGKGVAPGLGSFALIAPKVVLIAVAIFIFTLIVFRYVSLSSIASVASFPLLVWLLHEYHATPTVLALITISSFMIVLKHHKNIQRLLAGTEPRFQLGHK